MPDRVRARPTEQPPRAHPAPSEVADIGATGYQIENRLQQVRVESHGGLGRNFGLLPRHRIPVGEDALVVIADIERRPGRGVVGIQAGRLFEHGDGLAVGFEPVGHGQAPHVELVGFSALRLAPCKGHFGRETELGQ